MSSGENTGLTRLLLQAGAPDDKPTRRGNVLWRSFWGAHQRFFRHLCMAAKVPGLVRMANVSAETHVVLLLLPRCLINFLKIHAYAGATGLHTYLRLYLLHIRTCQTDEIGILGKLSLRHACCVQAALADDKCVVIGLQSTGDARTVEAVAERAIDGELDDFVSGPKVATAILRDS